MTKREIRRLLATKVMGWKRRHDSDYGYYYYVQEDYEIEVGAWRPCEDVFQAAMVLEQFAAGLEKDIFVIIKTENGKYYRPGERWSCEIDPGQGRFWAAAAPTFAEAVCTAIAEFVKEQK